MERTCETCKHRDGACSWGVDKCHGPHTYERDDDTITLPRERLLAAIAEAIALKYEGGMTVWESPRQHANRILAELGGE